MAKKVKLRIANYEFEAPRLKHLIPVIPSNWHIPKENISYLKLKGKGYKWIKTRY